MTDIPVMQNEKDETNAPVQAEFDPVRWALLNPDIYDDEPKALASFVGETLRIVERQPFFM